MALNEVTDPTLIKQLEGQQEKLVPIDDRQLIGQLQSGKPLDLREMGRNAPQSAVNVVEDITLPARKPDEFVKGLGTMGGAMMEKMFSGQMESILSLAGHEAEIPTERWDELWRPYKEKYSTIDSFKRSMEKDPFGVLADVVSMVGGAGAAVNAAKKGTGAAIPEKLPVKLYDSAAKFRTTIPEMERAKMIRALLEENIPLTPEGIKKANGIITDINVELDGLIANADKAGKTVKKTDVLRKTGKLRKELSNKIESVRDRKILNGIIDRYLLEVKRAGKKNFTISELQEFKKDAYGKVTDFSKEKGNKRKTKDRVYSEISREAKEIIEEAAPGAKALNERQAPLLGIRKDLKRVVNRIENNNLISLRDPIQVGSATVIAEYLLGMPALGTAVGMTLGVLQKPAVKNRLARELYKLKKQNPTMSTRAMLETAIIALPSIIGDIERQEVQQQALEAEEMQAMP